MQLTDNLFLILLCLALAAVCLLVRQGRTSFPKSFSARCVWVCDGDTIWVRSGWLSRRRKLRLIGMDAPESEQAFGREAERCLRRLAQGKRLTVTALCADRYGRWVSRVHVGGCDLSLEMIRAGYAWPYYAYLKNLSKSEQCEYRRAGALAKAERKGLWSGSNPEAPWSWRKRHRTFFWRIVLWLCRAIRSLFSLH